MIRLLPASQRPQRRWRNGGGITTDIAVYPHASGDDDFLWRASLAEMDAPADFSPWPETDRILTLATGSLSLTIDGTAHLLTTDSDPLPFAGSAQAHGIPHAPCRIFNLMLRQGKARAAVSRWTCPKAVTADQLLLFAAAPSSISVGNKRYALETGDALLIETPNAAQVFRPSGAIIAAEIFLT